MREPGPPAVDAGRCPAGGAPARYYRINLHERFYMCSSKEVRGPAPHLPRRTRPPGRARAHSRWQCLYPLDATEDVDEFCCDNADARIIAPALADAPAPAAQRSDTDRLDRIEAQLMAPSAAPSPMLRPQGFGGSAALPVAPPPVLRVGSLAGSDGPSPLLQGFAGHGPPPVARGDSVQSGESLLGGCRDPFRLDSGSMSDSGSTAGRR